jgi:hypothetical protein
MLVRSPVGALVPFAFVVTVCLVDLIGGHDFVIIALVVIAPLLAATIVGPRLTGACAVAALAGAVGVGVWDQLEAPDAGGGRTAVTIRLIGIAVGGGVAVAASRAREARERRLTALVRVADVAQRAILNAVPATIYDLRFATVYQSAGVEASIGGDLYEVVDSRWGVRLLVGDVRGKGLDAVRLANRVLGCFRALAGRLEDPADLAVALDAEVAAFDGGVTGFDSEVAEIAGFDGEDFVTAIIAQIDPDGRLLLLNAGHPDPLLVRDGVVEVLAASDRQPPLGLGATPGADCVLLSRRDRLLFYTDGLTEARNRRTREFFPLVPAVQAAFADGELSAAVAELVGGLTDWTGGLLGDDVALVAVERTG